MLIKSSVLDSVHYLLSIKGLKHLMAKDYQRQVA